MMMMEFFSLTFMLLLPLMACRAVTDGQNPNVTNVMTHSQPTTKDSSSLHPPSGISGPDNTQRNPTPPSLQTTPTAQPTTLPPTTLQPTTLQPTTLPPKTLPPKTLPPKTLPPNVPTTATKSQSSPQSNSTLGQTAAPATTVLTSRASNQTLTSAGPPTLSSSTLHQDSGQRSTPQITGNKTDHPSTRPPRTTDLISTSTTPAESKSPSLVPDGGAKVSTGSSRTTKATTKAPLVHTTKANSGHDTSTMRSGDSKAVAGIIGGALVLMMLGFLIIYLKKRKLRKQQITTSDWAGPSPFLEGGADNGQVELRANNRISLSSFLPQRLSKRLSLLPETEEEMEDLTPGSTFGDKTKGSSFGRETAGNGVKESNGTAGAKAEMKSTEDSAETTDTKTQNNDPMTTNNNSVDSKPSPDLSAGPAPPADVENAPEPLSNGPEQP